MLEVALAIEASIAHNPFNVKCLIVQDPDNSQLHKSYYIVHIFYYFFVQFNLVIAIIATHLQ